MTGHNSLSNRKIAKYLFQITALFLISIINFSCGKDDNFDEELLYGKWRSGTLYYKYLSGYNGTTWDEADDVSEDEAQRFTWTLERSELTHIHIMEIGEGRIPKVYTVTELTSTSLRYHDNYRSYRFTKAD